MSISRTLSIASSSFSDLWREADTFKPRSSLSSSVAKKDISAVSAPSKKDPIWVAEGKGKRQVLRGVFERDVSQERPTQKRHFSKIPGDTPQEKKCIRAAAFPGYTTRSFV